MNVVGVATRRRLEVVVVNVIEAVHRHNGVVVELAHARTVQSPRHVHSTVRMRLQVCAVGAEVTLEAVH